MTMIDEELLRRHLHDAAGHVEVSERDVERVMAAARAPATEGVAPRVISSLHEHPRRQRLLVGAAVAVAVSAITIPLLHGETTPATSASLPPRFAAAQNVAGSGYFAPTSTGYTLNVANGTTDAGLPSVATSTKTVTTGSAATTSSTKIESTGRLDLTVARGRIEATLARLTHLVRADGGTVVSSQVQTATAADGNFAFGTIVLQVAQPGFSTLVAQAQGIGRVSQVTTSSVDVTGQFVDLQARITALEVARHQYLAIMTRASSISDVLAVQAQLNTLQSRIEQLQAQLKLLAHETTYATLSVNVTERGHHAATPRPRNGISRAFHGAVHGFVAGVEWLIRSSGPALFAVLCLGVLWLLGRVAWRSLRRRSL